MSKKDFDIFPRDANIQGSQGMQVYDEEKEEFVYVTKKDIERWVKEAITDMYERPPE